MVFCRSFTVFFFLSLLPKNYTVSCKVVICSFSFIMFFFRHFYNGERYIFLTLLTYGWMIQGCPRFPVSGCKASLHLSRFIRLSGPSSSCSCSQDRLGIPLFLLPHGNQLCSSLCSTLFLRSFSACRKSFLLTNFSVIAPALGLSYGFPHHSNSEGDVNQLIGNKMFSRLKNKFSNSAPHILHSFNYSNFHGIKNQNRDTPFCKMDLLYLKILMNFCYVGY